MARPRKNAPLDLSQPIDLTAGAIERLTCPTDKPQAFLRDTKAPALRVRVTPSGMKSYVFEAKLNRRTIRQTIGDVRAWSIEEARTEANRLRVVVDAGNDPRELERERLAGKAAKVAEEAAKSITTREAWDRYILERRPHWRDSTYSDHLKMVQEGGKEIKNRPKTKTTPGMMLPLMGLRLADLDAATIEAWTAKEAKRRPTRTRLALRLLKAFLRWADREPDLHGIADPTAASGRKLQETAGKQKVKADYLQREQLAAWFDHVRAIPNPVISAYLQCLLLTGARREELAGLKWDDVNFRWQGLTMGDKVEDSRAVPLTPYVAHLLQSLPRRNKWVFSSTGSESGRLEEPSIAHRKACKVAGLHVTLHGLRRSFKSLTEWLEVPVGVVAQIMGHKPSATAEKHYTVRPLDLLRVHHERIESWMLEQAGVSFDPKQAQGGLRVVDAS
ncbi:integrase family protein [Haliea sp. E1-2-M8]|uniref:tyrosine-type recombinase/integrase n=1 Tax=Haliea sp. E1-2-M8 TaxID=3064706 RepID=UPI00271E401D|nr:integrase family protein [Haliea sp. E1-2-M8]MDO8864148.1 integrase family protein [Haliea sp. E1-2-M8]